MAARVGEMWEFSIFGRTDRYYIEDIQDGMVWLRHDHPTGPYPEATPYKLGLMRTEDWSKIGELSRQSVLRWLDKS